MILVGLLGFCMATEPLIQSNRVSLNAATAMVGGRAEVRLRWQVNSGWLPAGGYKLYRVEGTNRVLVYPPPAKPAIGSIGRKTTSPIRSGSRIVLKPRADLQAMLDLAARPAPATIALFGGTSARASSSLEVFRARQSAATSLKQNKSVGPVALAAGVNAIKPVQDFFGKLGSKLAKPTLTAAQIDERKTLTARRSILISSLADPSVAEVVGLGATDKGVQAAQRVTYTLHEVGAEGTEAATPITQLAGFEVGKDAQPPAPTGILVTQIGHGVTELRWDRIPVDVEDRLGMALYRITRVDATGKTTLLTQDPLTIPDIPSGNTFVEPIAFFVDQGIPVGKVTYQITLQDGFGRSSGPGAVDIQMEDLRIPSAPTLVTGELTTPGSLSMSKTPKQLALTGPPTVRVFWRTEPDPQAQFNVYRVDVDTNSAPQKLTPTPIGGVPIPASDTNELALRLIGERSLLATPVSERGKFVNKIVNAKRNLLFLDTTALADRKYRYLVSAIYPFNGRESDGASTSIVDVPSLSKPGAVGAIQVGQFKLNTQKVIGARGFVVARTKLVRTKVDFQKSNVGQLLGPAKLLKPGQVAPRVIPSLEQVPEVLGGTVTISWSTNSPARNPLYRVYREVDGVPGSKIEVGQSRSLSFADGLPRSYSLSYAYSVVTESRWGIRGASSAATKFTAPASLAPNSPTLMSVSPDSTTGGLSLRWRPNPVDQQVKFYRVFRKGISGANFASLAPSFKVNATNALRARLSNAKFVAAGKGTRPAPASDPEDDTGYAEVAMIDVSSTQFKVTDGVATLTDSVPDPKLKYYYKVMAENQLGIASDRSDPLGSEPLKASVAAPASVAASFASSRVTVTWAAVQGANGYIIRRLGEAGAAIQISGVVTGTTFVDKSALRGRTYRYEVIARDAFGNVSVPTLSGPITVS